MEYTAGTMGIQAVPGAGKTFIITNLVAKLLLDMERNNEEGRILVLTYMNSAANNFKSRIRGILEDSGVSRDRFEVMTIHSLAMKIIRENTDIALTSEETEIIDDYRKNIYINSAIDMFKDIDNNENKINSFLSQDNKKNRNTVERWNREFYGIVANTIKLLKYADIDDFQLKNITGKDYSGILSIISPIYSNYQEMLRLEGYMDYDDILLMAYKILSNNPGVAEYYQKRYKYVFEDECQDSNLIQGKIIDIISSGKSNRKRSKQNLVRVGDVNQSITGTFTGSNPKFFIDFCKEAEYSYEMNMAGRSSKDIIDLANRLVEFVNEDRSKCFFNSLENLFIEEVEKGKGYKENPAVKDYLINTKVYASSYEEQEMVIKTYNYYKNKFPHYSIGVLCLLNSDVEEIAARFDSENIEYERLGSDSKERRRLIEDVKAVLDFLLVPESRDMFKYVVVDSFIKRLELAYLCNEKGDSSESLEQIRNIVVEYDAEEVIYSEEIKNKLIEKICKCVESIFENDFKHKLNDVFDGIKAICETLYSDISKLVEVICENMSLSHNEVLLSKYLAYYVESLEKYENADIQRVSIAFDRKNSRSIEPVLDSIYEVGEKEIEAGSLTLATLHKSKGLEWDAVIIMGLNNSDFPDDTKGHFRVDRKYLRDGYKFPEAFVNREIDVIKGEYVKNMSEYELDLKLDLINERIRLLYVGITRAKRSVLMMCSNKKYVESINKTFFRKESEFLTVLKTFIDTKRNK